MFSILAVKTSSKMCLIALGQKFIGKSPYAIKLDNTMLMHQSMTKKAPVRYLDVADPPSSPLIIYKFKPIKP